MRAKTIVFGGCFEVLAFILAQLMVGVCLKDELQHRAFQLLNLGGRTSFREMLAKVAEN